MLIRTEQTPNPATRKFLPGQTVMDAGTRDFADAEAAPKPRRSPRALFDSGMVEGVFYGRDFVSVTAAPGVSWTDLEPLVVETLLDHFVSGAPLFAPGTRRRHPRRRRAAVDRGRPGRRRHHRPDQGADRNPRPPGGRAGRRRHRLQGLSRRPALSVDARRLLGLPVVDRHAEARHREPDPPLRPRSRDGRGRLTSEGLRLRAACDHIRP